MARTSSPIPQAAAALGYLGALPFVFSSFALWFVAPEIGDQLVAIMILTGAIVFGFVGGLQLGMSLLGEDGASFRQLAIGAVVISFAAFIASSQIPSNMALVLLAVAFVVQLWTDLTGEAAGRSPNWYPGLRFPLTTLVVLSLLSAAIEGWL